MLTPLQRQIRQIVGSLPDSEDLALAGGGALIVHGIVDRETRDLDFFSNSPEEVDRLLPSVEQALRDDSLVVERLRVAGGFAQLSVTSASETTTIDLAWDPRLLPPTVTTEGPVLAEEEVAAGKVLAYSVERRLVTLLTCWHLNPVMDWSACVNSPPKKIPDSTGRSSPR